MTKIRGLVLKVASRCNLNCSYCYMYNMGDGTYQQQPKVMTDAVVDAVLDRTREHCDQEDVREFSFAFHGGEPMLAGPEFFNQFVAKAHCRLPEVKLHFVIQTNGVLLDTEWANLFARLGVQIGISLDGTREENDAFRQDYAGRGSYDKVVQGLAHAKGEAYHARTVGVLSVVNIEHDPIVSYTHFKGLGVARIDYLLPYNHYSALPQGLSMPLGAHATPYGDWLIQNFDAWYQDALPRPDIRTYTGIIQALLGGEYPTDLMGSYDNGLLVVETDGSLEAVDYLKSCGEGFTKTIYNVRHHSFAAALQDPLIDLYVHCHQRLAPQCLQCPIQEVCGGGHLTSRYNTENGFNNPSIFCHDLLKLITHIQNTILADLPAGFVQEAELSLLDYQQTQQAWQAPARDQRYQAQLELFRTPAVWN